MSLIERAKNLLLSPKAEWPRIEAERTSPQELFTGYIAILAAIGPVASLIGMSVVGIELPFVGRIRTSLLEGIPTALITYALSLALVYILSRIINWLAPTFGGSPDREQAMKLAAYTCTAAWMGGLFSILPALSMLGIFAAMYSTYLLYTGLPVLMKSSPDRTIGYLVSVLLLGFLVMIPITGLLMFINPAMHSSYGVSADPAPTESLKQLESFTKGLEQIRTNMEQTAETTAATAPRSAPGPAGGGAAADNTTERDIQQAMETVGSLLGTLGQQTSNGGQTQVADFRVLQTLLPDSLPGMRRETPTGEREAMFGVDRSQATGVYVGEHDSRITIDVVDIGGQLGALGLAAFSWAASGAIIDKETATGYERSVTYRGHKALETYQTREQSGSLAVMVGTHAAVTVSGSGVPMETLRKVMDRIDLDRVSSARNS